MATKKYKANEDFNIDWSLFRSNLHRLMESKGYNKADLARALNLSISTISRYFYETTPDIIAIWLIADHFNVTIDWLIGRANDRWETLSPELKTIADRYIVASDSDKLIINTLLEKYGK